jgi:hypothetical protein
MMHRTILAHCTNASYKELPLQTRAVRQYVARFTLEVGRNAHWKPNALTTNARNSDTATQLSMISNSVPSRWHWPHFDRMGNGTNGMFKLQTSVAPTRQPTRCGVDKTHTF